MHFDGHTAQVGLRAELREAYAHADGLRVAKEKLEAAGEQEAIRGRCPHLCCRRRYDELVKLRLEVPRASARSTSAPPSRRTSAEAALEAKVQEQAEKMKELEQEVTATRYQRQYHREVAKRASLAASSKSTELESIKLELSTREAHLQQVAKQKAALESRVEHQRERNRELQRRSTELARECAGAEAALEEAEAAMQEAEADAAGMEASNAVLESKVEHLETRSEELRRLKISLGKRGNKYGPRVCEPLPASSSRSGEDPRELLGVAPKLLSPQSKLKRRRLVTNAKRRITDDADGLYELLGEGRDAVALATALDALDMLDELWETPQLWALRIKSHQALVALINEAWNAELAARMKKDYLLSDRDLDAIRCDFSMTIVNGKPVPRILVVNPYRPWDRSQQVHFPEPITKRCDGWAVVVKAQADFFGITINEEHEDMSERNFSKHLQQLVTRDEHTLESPATFGTERRLTAVVGFDGFSCFCHVLLRLIDYNPDVAKESELKGTGLCVARGDDHNANLARIFANLGPDINSYITSTRHVEVQGRSVPVDLATCLDYAASRSMPGLRTNASPHSLTLSILLVIDAPQGSSWAHIKKLILKKMPWRVFDDAHPLNHVAPHFPWKCSRCAYTVASEAEQDERIQAALALDSITTPAGKKATAARVKVHCEAHDDVMEYQTRIIRIHMENNIVDLLHAMDINIPQRLLKFSCHDKVLFGENKRVSTALKSYYDFIGCPFDPSGDKSWWHGSVWHYDIVLGTAPKSPGLDVFICTICLICYGVAGSNCDAAETTVVDDLGDDSGVHAQATPDDALQTILRSYFGHNSTTVRAIFESFVAYAELFDSVNASWAATTTAYKETRATATYRAGVRQQKAMNAMSNGRCDSDYFPLMAYVASQQMATRGNLWPYSTRAVEGRGGRYKRIDARITCKRKRAKEAVWKAVRNKKHGTVSFKKTSYNSTRTLQLLTTSCSQEKSAHGLHGRSRLSTTGRKTLARSMPKWQQEEAPLMGRLLDPVALRELITAAALQFTGAVNFSTEACLVDPTCA